MEPLRTGLLAHDNGQAQSSCSHGGVAQEPSSSASGHGDGACNGHGHGHSHNQEHGHSHMQGHGPDSVGQQQGQNGGSNNRGVGGVKLDRLMFDSLANSVSWLNSHDPAECPSNAGQVHVLVDCERTCCDHSVLNSTANLLVMVRAQELIMMSRVNACLAILSVLYMAVNLTCFILNSYDNDCDPKSPGCSPATTPFIFHSLEFWATFVFNIVDLLALSYSPRTLSSKYQNPVLLKLLVLVNVGMSFWSCLLVSINLEKFEVLSHELEYTNELTLTIFDATILINLVRGRSHEVMRIRSENKVSMFSLVVAMLVATTQLGVYNLSGWTADGDSKGERLAHYLEFTFGIASAVITFWFTMDNRLCAEKRMRQIMYGSAREL